MLLLLCNPNLLLGHAQGGGQLSATALGDVAVEEKLLLQAVNLEWGE